MEQKPPFVEQPATCLTIALVAGAVLGVAMNWDRFDCYNIDKPFVAILSLSWFPWTLTKFHTVKSSQAFWGFAILVSFVGWDAMARIVARGAVC